MARVTAVCPLGKLFFGILRVKGKIECHIAACAKPFVILKLRQLWRKCRWYRPPLSTLYVKGETDYPISARIIKSLEVGREFQE